MRLIVVLFFFLLSSTLTAQIDTLNTRTNKLLYPLLNGGSATYAVYFEDSLGRRISSADLWDRRVKLSTNVSGQREYRFEWTVWRKDSLQASIISTGLAANAQPISHQAEYLRRGSFSFQFIDGVVTVPGSAQKNAKDSALRVVVDPPAFAFPMDLEILPLVPMKKVGQQFAIAFYEPGSAKSNYYLLTVTGKEALALAAGHNAPCWLLRLDYGRGTYATFWISEKKREVLKMREFIPGGRFRYKVKLF
jgi:hypothetical protein